MSSKAPKYHRLNPYLERFSSPNQMLILYANHYAYYNGLRWWSPVRRFNAASLNYATYVLDELLSPQLPVRGLRCNLFIWKNHNIFFMSFSMFFILHYVKLIHKDCRYKSPYKPMEILTSLSCSINSVLLIVFARSSCYLLFAPAYNSPVDVNHSWPILCGNWSFLKRFLSVYLYTSYPT